MSLKCYLVKSCKVLWPHKVTVKITATIKNHMTLIRYKDLVSKLYCELKEEVVTGSFLVLTTGPVLEPSKVPLEKSKIK